MELICVCCAYAETFRDDETAFQVGWNAPPHFTATPITCPLCPSSCIVLGQQALHNPAHDRWAREGRPANLPLSILAGDVPLPRSRPGWSSHSADVDMTLFERMMVKQGVHHDPWNSWSGVGDGWVPLIERLITDLKALGWRGNVGEVKEKYGGLRFITMLYPLPETEDAAEMRRLKDTAEAMRRLISEAEAASLTLCENCGEPAQLRQIGGWYFTACEEHAGGAEPTVIE